MKNFLLALFLLPLFSTAQFVRSVGYTNGNQTVIEVPTQSWGNMTQAWLYKPAGYDFTGTKKYPCIVFLHGAGEGCGWDINIVLNTSLPQLIAGGLVPAAQDSATGVIDTFLVVSPFAANSCWSYGNQTKWIIEDIKQDYRIDTNAIFITGLSAGGAGTHAMAEEDSVWTTNNIAGIFSISTVDYPYGTLENFQGSIRNGLAHWEVMGSADSHLAESNNYSTWSLQSPPPSTLPYKHGYHIVSGGGHNSGVWNTAYQTATTWYWGMNIFKRMLSYRGNRAIAPPPPAPTVNAGADSTLTISTGSTTDTAWLHGYATNTSGAVTYAWSKISGPGTPSFITSSSRSTYVTGLQAGSYVFRLSVTDDNGTGTDDVTLTVQTCGTGATQVVLGVQGDGGALYDGGGAGGLQPGSTIFIDSATGPTRTYIAIWNIKGAPGCPIKLENRGHVTMQNGFDIANTQYFHISGKGAVGSSVRKIPKTGDTLGITVKGKWKEVVGGTFQTYAQSGAIGLELHENNIGFEIYNVEITKTKYGMVVKNNEDADSLLNFPVASGIRKFRAYNMWIHYTESQGMYAGTTGPLNAMTMDRINPTTKEFPNPARLGEIEVFNCQVDSTGRGGLQLAVATYGYSYMHDNFVNYSGGQTDEGQGGNLTLGGYTNVISYKNNLQHALTWNIVNYGSKLFSYYDTLRYAGYTAWTMASQIEEVADQAYTLAYGAPFHNRASFALTSEKTMDSARVVVKGAVMSNGRINESGSTDDDYAIVYYSSAATSVLPEYPYTGELQPWSKYNAIEGLTYDGSAINAASSLIDASYTPAIRVIDSTIGVVPWISAGKDIYTYETSCLLEGFAKALEGKTISSITWTKVLGPSGGTIVSSNTINTFITGLQPGMYKYNLKVVDNAGVEINDDVYVFSTNTYPTMSAGPDKSINRRVTLSTTLNGSSSDPDGQIFIHNWQLMSQTNSDVNLKPTISDKQASVPTITFSIPSPFSSADSAKIEGTYTFRHRAYDNSFQSKADDVVITVNTTGGNQAPTAGAGGDQTITLPTSSVTLSGTASDPDGTISGTLWSYISGPTTPTMVSPTSLTTNVTGLTVAGTYVFRLTATDNSSDTGSDDVTITVQAAPASAPPHLQIPKGRRLVLPQ